MIYVSCLQAVITLHGMFSLLSVNFQEILGNLTEWFSNEFSTVFNLECPSTGLAINNHIASVMYHAI